MANLTRYKLKVRWANEKEGFVAVGVVRQEGEWVKFEDVKELLNSSTNNAMVPCLSWASGRNCRVLFAGQACGSLPCMLSAQHQ